MRRRISVPALEVEVSASGWPFGTSKKQTTATSAKSRMSGISSQDFIANEVQQASFQGSEGGRSQGERGLAGTPTASRSC